ncbi:23S rRNA (uracil(1939)-C(5))-methyltransferase RlmD [Bacillus safensis subsp. safensis]
MKEKQQGALLQKGQQFPLTIKRLGINGEDVGYFKKQVVFVPGALPGEEVVVEATNVQAKYAEGTVRKVRKRSEHQSNRHAQYTNSAAAVSCSIWRMSSS